MVHIIINGRIIDHKIGTKPNMPGADKQSISNKSIVHGSNGDAS
jgi:hypothetical protein